VGTAGKPGRQGGEEGETDGAAAAAVFRPPRSRGAEQMAAGRPRATLGGILPGLLPLCATQVPSAQQKMPPAVATRASGGFEKRPRRTASSKKIVERRRFKNA